tara:strand:+ start:1303 stop:2967 length:1665 start_codon:yes stop_codon:yes gene_type:complete
MSNYTVTTDFAAKDSLPSGNTGKIIKGSDFSTEFNNLATVSAEKANLASPTFTGTVVIPTATITTANTATANITTANITTANVSGNVDMPDDAKVLLGTGDDLKLYHNGSHGFIEDSGTGGLKLLTSSLLIKNPADDEFMIKGTPDGSVDLYYNNGKKLETTDTGAKVSGAFVASAKIGVGVDAPQKPLHIFNAATDVVARIESGDVTAGLELIDETSTAQFKVSAGLLTIGTDTDGDVADSNISLRVDNVEKMNVADDLIVIKEVTRINDDKGLSFGNTNDLTITHVTGTNVNTVQNSNNRALLFNGVSFIFQNQNADEKLLELTANGAVDLYHNNAKKLETTATGATVTGVTTTDTLVVEKAANGILTEFKIGAIVAGAVRATVGGGVGDITLGSGVVGLRYLNAASGASANISPYSVNDGSAQDDSIDLGSSAARFDDIYATNGTINTSDANEKQSIEELTEAETRVAVACKGLIRKFKWNSAVEKKGSEARYHFGVIAQDLQAAFAVEGLDAGDYGLFISSTWIDDNGVEQTRLGVRYTELLAFIIGSLV